MTFWAYPLRCTDDTFYCGHTDHLEHRLGQHHTGAIDGHTKHHRPVVLVWSAEFPTRLEALEAERRIKSWSRAKKDALIRSDWNALSLLSRNRQTSGHPSTSSGRMDIGGNEPLAVSPDPPPVRPEPVEGCPAPKTLPPEAKSPK